MVMGLLARETNCACMQCGHPGSVAVELQLERWLQQASRTANSHSTRSVQPTALPPTLLPTPGGAMLLQSYIMVGMHAVDDVVVLQKGLESSWLQASKVSIPNTKTMPY